MTEYERSLKLPLAFGAEDVRNTLAEVLARAGIRNLRIAETEKYAHVTYFLNGGAEKPFELEERVLIPSSKVATYDLEPEMQALAIATAGGGGNRERTLRRGGDEFREPGHGWPYGEDGGDGEGGGDVGRGAGNRD